MSDMSDNPRLFTRWCTDEQLQQDGHRLDPSHASLGDDSVPCRWWHPDMGAYCGRCGSGRIDLHDGVWARKAPYNGALTFDQMYGPVPWTDVQRLKLGLEVEEQWWHQAAGLA